MRGALLLGDRRRGFHPGQFSGRRGRNPQLPYFVGMPRVPNPQWERQIENERLAGLVQELNIGGTTSATGTLTKTITLDRGTTDPFACVILASAQTNTGITNPGGVTDTQGNTWTRNGSPNGVISVWWTTQDVGQLQAGDVMTLSYTANVFNWAASVWEFYGIDTSTVLSPGLGGHGNACDLGSYYRISSNSTLIPAPALCVSAVGAGLAGVGPEVSFQSESGFELPPTPFVNASSGNCFLESMWNVYTADSVPRPTGYGGVPMNGASAIWKVDSYFAIGPTTGRSGITADVWPEYVGGGYY